MVFKHSFIWLIILCFVLTVSACSGSSNEKNTNNDASKGSQLFLTGKQFPNGSDFQVHDFNVTYNETKHALIIDIKYRFGDIPKKFLLKGKHKYYCRISVPQEQVDLFSSEVTEAVEGQKVVKNDKLKYYEVALEAPLKTNASKNKIDELVKNPRNFVLTIFEHPDAPAKVVVNIDKGVGEQ